MQYLEGVSAKIQESIKAAEQDLNKEKKKEESEEVSRFSFPLRAGFIKILLYTVMKLDILFKSHSFSL